MRRLRADAKLMALSVEQRELVEDWLMGERLSLSEVRERIKTEFGLSVSLDTVARHERRLRQADTVATFNESLAAARTVPGKLKEDGAALLEASMLLLRQQAFDWLSTGEVELEALERIGRMLIRSAEAETSAARVELAEYKQQQKVIVETLAKADELRPVWMEQHLSAAARLRAATFKIFGYLDPKNMELYQKDLAEEAARKCPACEQVRPWKPGVNSAEYRKIFGIPEREGAAEVRSQEPEGAGENDQCGAGNSECGVGGANPKTECQNPKLEATPHPDPLLGRGGEGMDGNPKREKLNPKEAGEIPKSETLNPKAGQNPKPEETKSTPNPNEKAQSTAHTDLGCANPKCEKLNPQECQNPKHERAQKRNDSSP